MNPALAAGALLLLAAMPSSAQRTTPTWTPVPPQAARRTGVTSDAHLREASGAAPSKANPGIIWTVQDSDNPPDLIAMDTLGSFRGLVHVPGARNVDWEDVAVGPCRDRTCVYIADTGDNDERRTEVQIYRFVEPELPPSGSATVPPPMIAREVETLHVRYPDGAHDVEAMGVTPTGTILLVTKGRSGGIRAFRLARTQWNAEGQVSAELLDSLPLVASAATGNLVTGLAVAPDGREVMLRTYRDLFPFELDRSGHLQPNPSRRACDILGLEPQGEGVGYLDSSRLVLTSERGLFPAGSVWIVECHP
jgi:hypothetical protein